MCFRKREEIPCCHGQIAPRFYPRRTRKLLVTALAARNKTLPVLLSSKEFFPDPTCALGVGHFQNFFFAKI